MMQAMAPATDGEGASELVEMYNGVGSRIFSAIYSRAGCTTATEFEEKIDRMNALRERAAEANDGYRLQWDLDELRVMANGRVRSSDEEREAFARFERELAEDRSAYDRYQSVVEVGAKALLESLPRLMEEMQEGVRTVPMYDPDATWAQVLQAQEAVEQASDAHFRGLRRSMEAQLVQVGCAAVETASGSATHKLLAKMAYRVRVPSILLVSQNQRFEQSRRPGDTTPNPYVLDGYSLQFAGQEEHRRRALVQDLEIMSGMGELDEEATVQFLADREKAHHGEVLDALCDRLGPPMDDLD